MFYITLIITNIASLIGLFIVTKRSLILIEKMDDISEQIEESLDIIDEAYSNVSKHLKSPVLFDDPVVTSMIRDVKNAKDAMLIIANKVTEPFPNEIGSDEEEKSDRKEKKKS